MYISLAGHLRGLSVLAREQRCHMGSVIVVPTGAASTTRQGLTQFEGISAQSAGTRALCAHLLAVPPGGRAKAHRHAGHETAIYVLEGRGVLWFGEELESRVDVGPGDFLYIPPRRSACHRQRQRHRMGPGSRGPDRPQRARERGASSSLGWPAPSGALSHSGFVSLLDLARRYSGAHSSHSRWLSR
jgi:uncharacterized RmlC-like cupin family protein